MIRKIFSVVTAIALVGLVWHFVPAKHQVAHAQQYATCQATGASPLSCASAQDGIVTIAAAASSVVVQTSAVTANSRIFVQYDYSLGTLLSVTCNTSPQLPAVSARVTGTSFTITTGSTFTTNPGCFTFHITNQ